MNWSRPNFQVLPHKFPVPIGLVPATGTSFWLGAAGLPSVSIKLYRVWSKSIRQEKPDAAITRPNEKRVANAQMVSALLCVQPDVNLLLSTNLISNCSFHEMVNDENVYLSLIHISEPTRPY